MNKKLKISVIIPVFNCESKIERSINSVLNQHYSNFQLIVINDGSSDNSHSIIKRVIDDNKEKEIVYYNIKNSGVSHARNIGLEAVNGDVVTFLDADDYYDNGFFKCVNDNMCNNDILLFGYRTIFKGEKSDILYGRDLTGEKDYLYRELSKKNLFNPVCNKVYSKKIIHNVRFNEKLDLGEDFLFFTECLYNATYVKYINDLFYNYEISISGLGFKNREYMFEKKVIGMQGLRKLYVDNHYDIRDISGIYVKDLIVDFISLQDKKKLSKSNIVKLQKLALNSFNFNLLSYKLIYLIMLKLFLSNNYLLIYLFTFILSWLNKMEKRKKFKIKRK